MPTQRGAAPAGEPARGDNPVYERLVREWAGAGRTLPGAPDREWARLIRYPDLLSRTPGPRHRL
ncbi:hypothetical protein [Streptomyces yaizuensis]|uniref:Uncharacterized protein n=1 Tax=Streptomyces yaizuensis TaxID=2989713 RepID=A0ABQ5NVW6_9ACTN|nr:hypothetical protein [Streptomyces sp. YSPA8]GLF94355.1 hypothetical protein SYYSPA8_08680 [Streptomyces sp. YSPA8]